MQNSQESKSEVQSDKGVAEILELLAALVRQRLAPAPNSREQAVAGALEDEVGPVPEPGLGVGKGADVDVINHLGREREPGLTGVTGWKFAIIVGGANPHVPHKNGEENHHGQSAI